LATPACKKYTCEPYYMGVLLFGQVIFWGIYIRGIDKEGKYIGNSIRNKAVYITSQSW